MTRKEWLLQQGLISQIGRGRISKSNLAAIDKAMSEGVVFSDVASSATPKRQDVVSDITILWPEKAFKAVTDDGTMYGMREVCNNCRVSLVTCWCHLVGRRPHVLGEPVTIVSR